MSNNTNETPKSFEDIKKEITDKWVIAYEDKEQQIEFQLEMEADLDALLAARNEQVDVWGNDEDGQYHKMYVEKLQKKFYDGYKGHGFDIETEGIWQWILDNCLTSPATKTRDEIYEWDEDSFQPCYNCDLPDACRDFGCAVKQGI